MKAKLPMMENMKKINIKRRMTLFNEGIENIIVSMIAFSPSDLPSSLRTLVTLSTLMILAIYGPTDKKLLPATKSPRNLMKMSKNEAATTKKSNLFHEFLK